MQSSWEVLRLFLIPVGGGIPSGVLAAKNRAIAWPLMTFLYFVSDVVLAIVFEPLMLAGIRLGKGSPIVARIGEAFRQSTARTTARFGTHLGPLALILVSFGVDPMTGRATAKAAGHGFVTGWALAITGDMMYFGVLAYSTLALNKVVNETWTTLIILAAMFVLPELIAKFKSRAVGS